MPVRSSSLPRLFRRRREAVREVERETPEYRGPTPPAPSAGEGGFLAAVTLFAVAGFGLGVLWLLDWGRSMVLLAVPLVYPSIMIVGSIGLVAAFPAKRWGLPVRIQRLFLGASAVMAGAMIAFLLAGLYARDVATTGPSYRASLIHLDNRMTGFEDENGRMVVAMRQKLRISRMGQCFLVRRLDGPLGFAWLELLEASPLPRESSGGCFGSTSLSPLER